MLEEVIHNEDEFTQKLKRGDYSKEARAVLQYMQNRDYKLLSRTIDCAKDVNLKDLSFGRVALDIPEDHYEVLKLIYPDLVCPDADIKTKAWKAFCISEESLPYKPNINQRTM